MIFYQKYQLLNICIKYSGKHDENKKRMELSTIQSQLRKGVLKKGQNGKAISPDG